MRVGYTHAQPSPPWLLGRCRFARDTSLMTRRHTYDTQRLTVSHTHTHPSSPCLPLVLSRSLSSVFCSRFSSAHRRSFFVFFFFVSMSIFFFSRARIRAHTHTHAYADAQAGRRKDTLHARVRRNAVFFVFVIFILVVVVVFRCRNRQTRRVR